MRRSRRGYVRVAVAVGAALIAAAAAPAAGPCEIDKLVPSLGSAGDGLGCDVDLSGDLAIVGGFFADAAYVYRLDGSSWVEEAVIVAANPVPDDLFGKAVGISGGTAVVGASGDADNGGFAAGAVYVFRYEPASGRWVQEAKLLASDGEPDDRFGWSVAISGDTVVAGAHFNTNKNGQFAGAAYVFRFDGSTWVEEAKLLASDGDASDFFGHSVAIDDELAVVGAFGHDAHGNDGSAYVFRVDGSVWLQEAELLDSEGGADFGISVAVSGDAAVVGAYADGPTGSALVFRLGCLGWREEVKLRASDGEPGDLFGGSVAIDGGVVVVGDVGDNGIGVNSGAAYVFRFDGHTWQEEAKLLASDGAADDNFGDSVAVSGDMVIVGADGDDDNGSASGSAYVVAGLLGADCNGNGVADACDIEAGTSPDADGNQVPDECDCPWDLDRSGRVATGDLLALLGQWGQGPAGPPDFDGDGVVGTADLLVLLGNWGPCPLYVDCNGNGVFDTIDVESGASPDCNGNGVPDECDVASATSPDCNGNGIPDECDLSACTSPDCNRNFVPDECDVSSGASPDGDGDGVPDECAFSADACEDAAAIGDGVTPFFTIGATTDGPMILCKGPQLIPALNDVWFVYTPSCTGTVTFSLCDDADFDSVLAVYLAGLCPSPETISPLACSDDAGGCGQTSMVELFAAEGIPYLVRVGGSTGEEGRGNLTVSCQPLP